MSIYQSSARFDSAQRALTEDELYKIAPSIFATTSHPSRSESFQPISTIDVVRDLHKEGFSVVGATATRSRGDGRYSKHLLRIRPIDGAQKRVGDTVFEMLLKNANDGSGAYDLMAGLFRIACLNSVVAALATLGSIRVRHVGKDVSSKVIDGTFRVMSSAEPVLEAASRWSQVQLDMTQRQLLAHTAHELRFGDSATHVSPGQLLTPRRHADTQNDLWSVFNVIQENVIRGGVHTRYYDDNGRRRNSRSRAITGINESLSVNRGLWQAAEALAA